MISRLRRNRRPSAPSPSLGRDFHLLWAGQSASELGDRVSELALPFLAAVGLHASVQQVALLAALTWTPNLLGLVIGTWVEQFRSKRRLMALADLVRAASLCSVPFAYLCHSLTLTQLYAVALVNGTAAVFFGTAYSSFFTQLIPREAYLAANSRLNASRSASFVAGPSMGGLLVQFLGAPFAVLADAASFLASAVTLQAIRLTPPPSSDADAPQGPFLRRMKGGFALLSRDPLLRACLGCSTTVNLFTFLSSGLLVVYANRTLGLSAGALGLALGVGAVGALVGALLAPKAAKLLGTGRTIALGAVVFPAPIAIMAAAGGPLWLRAVVLGAAEFLSGAGVMLFDVNLNSLQAWATPADIRSRISGAFKAVNFGVRPLGAILGGALAAGIGLRATLVVTAVGGAASVFWVLWSPIFAVRDLSQVAWSAPAAPDTSPSPSLTS
ncbi:putative MFS family arabinose efflux permease [Streptacidiphilus sp. MAP12-20]|uniref:MFS transporter n=1 Tax=Streptacidiphilus sp. MAP12-20 TaxID=3156299 RepID=UPI0035150387